MLSDREAQLWLAVVTILAVSAFVAVLALWGRLMDTRTQFEALTDAHSGLATQVDAQAEWGGHVHTELWGADPAADEPVTDEQPTVEAGAALDSWHQQVVANGSTAAGRHRHRA